VAAQEHEDAWEHRMATEFPGFLPRLCERQNVRARVEKALKLDAGDISRSSRHEVWHVDQKEGFVFLRAPSPHGPHDRHLALSGDALSTLGGVVAV
jgi:hypothetical protein